MHTLKPIKDGFNKILKAYAWVLFIDHPLAGVLFILTSFWSPNIGLCGLLASLIATVTVQYFKFTYHESGIHIFNSLLVGLSLGAFYQLDFTLLLFIIISAVLTVLVTVMLSNLFTKIGNLPVLTLPFILVAITMAFAAKANGQLKPYFPDIISNVSLFPEELNSFFTALGSIFFLPNPLVGLLLFVGILSRSRYLALLCVAGFVVGFNLYGYIAASEHDQLAIFNGFNFSLTAMALGGIYTVPGVAGFIIACVGAAIAALVTAGAQSFLSIYELPVMAIPFILTTLTVLSALSARQSMKAPWLMLNTPDLPEKHFERARLARARIGDIYSVPLLAPFFGTWQVYQGFRGRHTHKAPWQFALDFIKLDKDKSYRDNGLQAEDFYCFGLPVISPAYGTVVRTLDTLPDNAPGEMDLKNNWGNFVLIRLASGLYVLLGHLKQQSVKVKENDRVTPGQVLAACGNSGRSPQPHLHLQVQTSALLGSATYPFHLNSVVIQQQNEAGILKLVAHPEEKDSVTPLEVNAELSHALHLPVGRQLCFNVKTPTEEFRRTLTVVVTLYGEFRLQSDTGASAAFQEANGLLAFYDRTGPRDSLLDLWLLALGLTPFSAEVKSWEDEPSAHLLPLNHFQRILYATQYPLGSGLQSSYERSSVANHQWRQTASHELNLLGNKISAMSSCVISSDRGCESLVFQINKQQWQANLIEVSQVADIGVPAKTV